MQGTQEMRAGSLDQEDPLEEGMATHSSILVKFHGQRSLAGYSPRGLREWVTTERKHTYRMERQGALYT